MFMVINGSGDDKDDIELDGYGILPITNEIMILGTPISESGSLREDLNTHLNVRYKNSIKFLNFIRENRSAPTSIKLKVLTSCVTSTILYNCETFGPLVPDRLCKLYTKMIKSALNVRPNTPDEIVLIEAGLLPIRALIQKRQLKFF